MDEENPKYHKVIIRLAAHLAYSSPRIMEQEVDGLIDYMFSSFPERYSGYTKTEVKNALIVEVIKARNKNVRFYLGHRVSITQPKIDDGSLRPPFNAEFLLHFLLRPEEQEPFIGCLVEKYGRMINRFGKRRADLWFYFEVVRSSCLLVRRFVIKVINIVALGEWLHRMIR